MSASVIQSADHVNEAIDATLQGLVLLKNDESILPLNAKTSEMAVIGPHVNDRQAILGNYIGEICNTDNDDCVESPFEAMERLGISATNFTGCDVNSNSTKDFKEAVEF